MKTPTIIVVMEGGIVQDIVFPDNIDINVLVRDFDCEDCDPQDLTELENGDVCYETLWESQYSS